MLYASLGAGLSCVVLGTQMQLHWGPNWVTAMFIYVFAVMYTCGAGTVPFVLLAEVFLPEVSVATILCSLSTLGENNCRMSLFNTVFFTTIIIQIVKKKLKLKGTLIV